MKIFILARSLTYADAVSNDVLGLAEMFKKKGFEVEIICEKYHRRLRSLKIKKLHSLDSLQVEPSDVIVYHLTSGWPEGLALLKKLKCQKILRYHNITPPHFYEGISNAHTNRCQKGYEDLGSYAKINFAAIIGNSQYTLQGLREKDFDGGRMGVIPPLHQVESLMMISRDERLYKKLNDGSINILSVGRIAPNKGHLALVKAFANYYHHYNPRARLILVGKRNWKLRKYTKMIRRMICEHGIKQAVDWVNNGSTEKLKSCYEAADLWVSFSEHEGFCVPVVEAMAFGVPVLVENKTALSETVGDAGYVLTDEDSEQAGRRMHGILSNEEDRQEMVQKGFMRYENYFTPQKIEKQWLTLIAGLKESSVCF